MVDFPNLPPIGGAFRAEDPTLAQIKHAKEFAADAMKNIDKFLAILKNVHDHPTLANDPKTISELREAASHLPLEATIDYDLKHKNITPEQAAHLNAILKDFYSIANEKIGGRSLNDIIAYPSHSEYASQYLVNFTKPGHEGWFVESSHQLTDIVDKLKNYDGK